MEGLAYSLQGACKGLAKRLQWLLCVFEKHIFSAGRCSCYQGKGASRHAPNLTAVEFLRHAPALFLSEACFLP